MSDTRHTDCVGQRCGACSFCERDARIAELERDNATTIALAARSEAEAAWFAVEAERERCLRWVRQLQGNAWDGRLLNGIRSGAEPPGEGKL